MFGSMGLQDGYASEEEKPMTKKSTNKKLEGANKQSHKADAGPRYQKMNANQAKQDGFAIAGEENKTDNRRGGGDRGGRGRGGRGGERGGRRGDRGRGGDRGGSRGRGGPPRTAE